LGETAIENIATQSQDAGEPIESASRQVSDLSIVPERLASLQGLGHLLCEALAAQISDIGEAIEALRGQASDPAVPSESLSRVPMSEGASE
jgi:hypothetical protein